VKQLFACATLMAVFSAAGFAQSGKAAALAQVKTVYLLPMSHGMDQYLANRLTHGGVLQVVTDPAKADALLTDHLGEAYEASVKELYPQAKPAPAPAKDNDDKDAKTPSDAKPDQPEMKSIGADRPPVPSRNRGMVFLVKRDTSEVIWSAYHDPSIRKPKELNRAAGRLVGGLKKAMKPAAPAAPASPTAPADK
jgi:hypothetical protein